MLEPQMQVPSPAMGAMDELLARREKALALVVNAQSVRESEVKLSHSALV